MRQSAAPEVINQRHTQLFTLGMAKTANGFAFQDISISSDMVEKSIDDEYEHYLTSLTFSINEKKRKVEYDLKSDKQKLEEFVKSLGHITGPELKEVESNHILFGALELIRCAREFIVDELKKSETEEDADTRI